MSDDAPETEALTTANLLEEPAPVDAVLTKGVIMPSTGGDPGAELPGAEPEPVFGPHDRDEIQGNIVPGFNKDHQHFLFLRIRKAEPAKEWLRWIAPLVSSMDDVLAFVRAHRSLRHRLGVREPGLKATWVNVAFSYPGIVKLAGEKAAAGFGEESFRQGLAARSTYLGDPAAASAPGYRGKWVVGGPKNEADVLVVIASDDPGDLDEMVALVSERATGSGMTLLFEQRGATLPGRLGGHEHFGFKDGVSQPGVRGKVSTAPGDFVTPRHLDPSDRYAGLFGKPGQALVWPGQFLLGERRQSPQNVHASAPAATNFPRWARRGSFLVCRRLTQDVPAFWEFVRAGATATGLGPRRFASMLVGRWPSGAPIMRAPDRDDGALAGNEFANNHFLFDDDTPEAILRTIPPDGPDDHPQAEGDALGAICPHFAHIRKANPRDAATDLGHPADSLTRMILRRGIPFGTPVIGVKKPSRKLLAEERGLMFLCFGATIEDQFEFLTRRWANSPVQPNLGGHDPIVGQEGRGTRQRFVDFPTPSGPLRLTIDKEWVTVTGGGYFFAPPISALTGALGG